MKVGRQCSDNLGDARPALWRGRNGARDHRCMEMQRVKTRFDPKKHGFRFRNTFPITYQDVGIPYAGQLGQGLCGGMCLHAKRLYRDGAPVPTDTKLPAKGSALYSALWRRQLQSLFPTTWARFIRWQARPDSPGRLPIGSIGHVTKKEWPKLRRMLDAGEPAVLGLVRIQSKNPARAGANHQVLCTGYSFDPGPRHVRLDLYDPNHPGRSVELVVDLGQPGHRIGISQSTGETLRGFFVIAAQ